jgi:Zn-dependent M28 family amino/carboxypeptidase
MSEIIKAFLLAFVFWGIGVVCLIGYMTWMPSAKLLLDEKTISSELAELEAQLRGHVEALSKSKVGRNYVVVDYLTPAKRYISEQFEELGYKVTYHNYKILNDEHSNIIVDIPSGSESAPVLIVGAHYDSVEYSPGANDNASGVAAIIEMGRYFAGSAPKNYRLRLIAFANEEPPFYQTEEMGSLVYAKSLTASEDDILGMISLETIGYYTEERDSQKYPAPFNYFYPDTGNFVAFVGNLQSRAFVTSSISLFRQNSSVPSEGVASPGFVPGVSWSDHWSFWVSGHDAIMVTDTALYRYEHYHKSTDTPDKLNYQQYAKVVYGLCKMVEGLLDDGF